MALTRWDAAEEMTRTSIADGTHNCDTNAACTDTDGAFTCACNTGFSGDGISCADIDECAGPPEPLPRFTF